jgi:hypothetical protein
VCGGGKARTGEASARGREKISGGRRREQRVHGSDGALANVSLDGVYGLDAEEDSESRLETKSLFSLSFFNKYFVSSANCLHASLIN